jgi:hypothetical protein
MRRPKKIVLDPSGAYPVPEGCTQIETEVDWIRAVGTAEAEYWIKGQHLCHWTREWLRAWNVPASFVEEKEFPRVRLQSFLKQIPIPQGWTQEEILTWVNRLESHDAQNPIPNLLSDVVPSAGDVWLDPPSCEHFARWLQTSIPGELAPFEDCWRAEIASRCDGEIADGYRSGSKLDLLRRWLLISGAPFRTLGCYPYAVPDVLEAEFRDHWARRITETRAGVLDVVNPSQQPGMKLVAGEAYEAFRQSPAWITQLRLRKVASFLDGSQARELSSLLPPTSPLRLPMDASPAEALRWATHGYLPYRRWEACQPNLENAERLADDLADSFVQWLVKKYPELKLEPVDSAFLNYSAASLVLNLTRTGPVLWVVVDGMGWLEECELVEVLATETDLRMASGVTPKISILPTKTEYAKWALFAQLLPSDGSWVKDVAKGFAKIGTGQRYTDTPSRRDALIRDLQAGDQALYCWDTTWLDSLYHDEVSWQQLSQVGIPQMLRKIAHQISFFVGKHPRPHDLQLVLSSDHGQMMGLLQPVNDCPPGFAYTGRLCEGRVPDSRFITLDADRFGLPHDVSVIRGGGCIRSFQANHEGTFVGTHGGLFPEEVVVGVSVLRYALPRRPVIASCTGDGKPRQQGEICILITNPNDVPLTGICLYVDQLTTARSGQLLDAEVPASSKTTWRGSVSDWPQLPVSQETNELKLTGRITFRFGAAEEGSADLSEDSRIRVDQIFRSGMDIDEFL